MTVVADSTVLIYLAAIGKFDLLQVMYGKVLIPTVVHDEVVTQGAGRWGSSETAAAPWIECRLLADAGKLLNLPSQLDGGEKEVIALVEEAQADLVIMDEAIGRLELSKRGIPFIGTVGVLILAKKSGLISALKPELDQLRICGFHLSEHIYRACLASVGE